MSDPVTTLSSRIGELTSHHIASRRVPPELVKDAELATDEVRVHIEGLHTALARAEASIDRAIAVLQLLRGEKT